MNIKVDSNLTRINDDSANLDAVKGECEAYLEVVYNGFRKKSSTPTLNSMNSINSAELTAIQDCLAWVGLKHNPLIREYCYLLRQFEHPTGHPIRTNEPLHHFRYLQSAISTRKC